MQASRLALACPKFEESLRLDYGLGTEFNLINSPKLNVPLRAGLQKNIADKSGKTQLSLGTGISSKILSGVVTDVDPENLAASIDIEESRVILRPILLNSKDSVTLKLLVSDFGGNVNFASSAVSGSAAELTAGEKP